MEMLRNSAADTFYGGLTASKIRRLIRRAVIFPADFRRTNIRRRIRRRLRGLYTTRHGERRRAGLLSNTQTHTYRTEYSSWVTVAVISGWRRGVVVSGARQ